MFNIGTLLEKCLTLFNYGNTGHAALKTVSLTEVTKLARVEPLTIVSKDCMNLEYMSDVLQSLLSIFTGYYLQAVALSGKIQDVKVIKILDRLNPDRDANMLAVMDTYITESHKDIQNISIEAYKHHLPTRLNAHLGLEAFISADTRKAVAATYQPGQGGVNTVEERKTVNELSNLSVGKMIEVEIKSGEQCLKIPVNIRLAAATIPNHSILHILALKTEDTGIVERFHSWRSGRITFIKDLMLCQDLVTERKKALMNDNEGIYSEIISRVNKTKGYGLATMNPSLVSASNLFVISEETAKELENKLGGKLSDPRTREKAFLNTYAMIIVVIDRDYERVTFYHRGIAAATELSVKDIKNTNKAKGPDIMDIFKAFNMGSNPTF